LELWSFGALELYRNDNNRLHPRHTLIRQIETLDDESTQDCFVHPSYQGQISMGIEPYDLIAAIVASAALIVTFWQLSVVRKHNQLSVRPFLAFWSWHDGTDNTYSLYLQNNGIGPAIITSFSVYVDNKRILASGTKALEIAAMCLFHNPRVLVERAYVSKGYSMAANEKRRLIKLNLNAVIPRLSMAALEVARNRVRIVIEYNSIYETPITPPLDSDNFKDA